MDNYANKLLIHLISEGLYEHSTHSPAAMHLVSLCKYTHFHFLRDGVCVAEVEDLSNDCSVRR